MLKIGNNLPDIQLPNQDGVPISLRSFIGKNPLVIYFYPKNNTPGCTAQACSFRDRFEEFVKLGATVIGISRDSVLSHKKVAEKRKLPFTLLSDCGGLAENAFGVERSLFGILPGRVTFIANQEGTIIDVISSSIRPKSHITNSLKSLKTITLS